jgi:5'-nucleotidase
MRVLVTNDDGVEAPGLIALTEAVVAAGHDVLVVAPSGERSGSGAAIGRLHRAGPIACTEIAWPSLPDVPVYAIDAPPAATVYAGALGAFGLRPDAVASGINPGLNYGHLVIHSGTVGAALTAQVLGIPAVAVSIAWSERPHWTTAATVAVPALEWAATAVEATPVVNVNVPDLALAELLGVHETTLMPFAEQWTAEAHPGELHLEYVGRSRDPIPGSDVATVHEGSVAITLLAGVAATAHGNSVGAYIEDALAVYARS